MLVNALNYNCLKLNKKEKTFSNSIEKSEERNLPLKAYPACYFTGKLPNIDIKKLQSLNIPNFSVISNKGIRGESLSNRKNKRFIPEIAKGGIKQIIDLKTSDFSSKYAKEAEKYGLKYFHFPIDSTNIDDKTIIKAMPEFFSRMNKGNYYISCAQGMHRTDIALCLNYIFNPKETNPPILKGHYKDGSLRLGDIMRRMNTIYKNLSSEDIQKLGWSEYTEEILKKRKTDLIVENMKHYNIMQ